MTATFDPLAYKNSTRAQWDTAATAWDTWGPTIESWLGPTTEVMLDLARVGPGARVLDVAAGSGGQTLTAARRVGPTGRVLATDIAPAILALAEHNAHAAGLTNVAVQVMDGEELDVEPAGFDAVISRVGLIYFPDRIAALAGIRRALRPGGRLAAVVYSTPANNAFFAIPVSVIRERAGLPAPPPGAPGPFSLGHPGVAEQTLTEAGFTDVVAVRVDAPLRMSSTAECIRFEQESFGALHQMLAGLDQPGRDAAWTEITERLHVYQGPHGFVGPCEMIVVAGTAP
ncbi:MAG TPA: class I SAM-dependent methyltransferase [Sporichthyaceae bacterium]|nr:class I SAM-dependent methyltransferase [Sporichthyaceae bacterium]